MKAIRLRTEYMTNPIGVDYETPRLSWNCHGGITQTAYRITAVDQYDQETLDTGKVTSNQMHHIYTGDTSSRRRISWTVTLWDEEGVAGEPATAYFERGLLHPDWHAKWINPELDVPEERLRERRPGNLLRRVFRVDSTDHARLYITARGVYAVRINDKPIEEFFLAPGTAQYDKRLPVQTYDISDYLRVGDNEIRVLLGDGWHRGCMGFWLNTHVFGTDVALLCQLEVGGAPVLCSDESWETAVDSPLGLNDHMGGETYDARLETVAQWRPVRIEDHGFSNLIGQNSVPIIAGERLDARAFRDSNGDLVLDFGENIAGYVEIDVVAHAGQVLELQHGETLDETGAFTVANFQNNSVPYTHQKIRYICKEGRNQYHQNSCYFGFRYAKVTTDIDLSEARFTAVATYSDMEQVGYFQCANEKVNQLFRNAVRSMKGNFVDVPTDCPTREKSGFSGDCQAFVDTAMYLMECYPVYRKWLLEQQATQQENGKIYQVAPHPDGEPDISAFDGAAGWCDSIEIIPFKMWQRYNDDATVRENYEACKKWMLFSLMRQQDTRPENAWIPEALQPYYADQEFHWGEWCEPGTDIGAYIEHIQQHGEPEVATAYLSYGCRLVARMASYLGEEEDVRRFTEIADKAAEVYRLVFAPEGLVDSPRQCRYIRPVILDLLPEDKKRENIAVLARKIAENGYKLNTGFLTTYELCRVLTDYGEVETAYRLLLQEESPSWLYAVNCGATSIWENWDGMREDGTVRSSFNHYSYGAIVSWLMDRACGITCQRGDIVIRPYPHVMLGSAQASYNSPYGLIESSWEYTDSEVCFKISIPANQTAAICLPDGSEYHVLTGQYEYRLLVSVC